MVDSSSFVHLWTRRRAVSGGAHDLEDDGIAYSRRPTVFDILSIVTVIGGFTFFVLLGAWLGAGSHASLAEMLVSSSMPARPRGVQESDLPRFVFGDADAEVFGTGAA